MAWRNPPKKRCQARSGASGLTPFFRELFYDDDARRDCPGRDRRSRADSIGVPVVRWLGRATFIAAAATGGRARSEAESSPGDARPSTAGAARRSRPAVPRGGEVDQWV